MERNDEERRASLRLTNRTAIALKRSAVRVRRACFGVGLVLSLVMAALAVYAQAASPAATTSSCESGLSEMPAARFVTRESPATFIPHAFANTASGTVDIPTTSAPCALYARISAGVS